MTDPIYHYVPGQGWIPTTIRIWQGVAGQWRLTLENRRPNPGERFYCDFGKPEDHWDSMIEAVCSIAKRSINTTHIGADYDHATRSQHRSDYENTWMTVKVEPL